MRWAQNLWIPLPLLLPLLPPAILLLLLPVLPLPLLLMNRHLLKNPQTHPRNPPPILPILPSATLPIHPFTLSPIYCSKHILNGPMLRLLDICRSATETCPKNPPGPVSHCMCCKRVVIDIDISLSTPSKLQTPSLSLLLWNWTKRKHGWIWLNRSILLPLVSIITIIINILLPNYWNQKYIFEWKERMNRNGDIIQRIILGI